nr:hypothetical protein OG409_10240 [Streptomyces sp. NBC_00974]
MFLDEAPYQAWAERLGKARYELTKLDGLDPEEDGEDEGTQHIGEVREVSGWCVTRTDGGPQEFEGFALEGRVAVGVLDEEPCIVGTLLADQRNAGPAVLGDDFLEPYSVFGVDSYEVTGLTTVEKLLTCCLFSRGTPVELGGDVP